MKQLHLSLRVRLLTGFTLLTLICWGAASLSAWYQTREKINELFDTQQMLFAKRLATMDLSDLSQRAQSLPETKQLLRHHRGDQEDDALAFAIFTRDGQMVLNDGDNGKDFLFDYSRNGFDDGRLRDDDDQWRMLWLESADRRYLVVVGQEWEYRDDMTRDIVRSNFTPWLFALPVMLLLLLWLVTRELAPLKRIARQLRQRAPDDGTPITSQQIPQEVTPLVDALNALFARTGEMVQRERRFTSDAAHELRSPLAALKVQTEVAQLADDDTQMRQHALENLNAGIDRATRLVDQLLTLSRLDGETPAEDLQAIDLHLLLQQAVIDHDRQAQQAGVTLHLQPPAAAITRQGQPLLLTLLVRNLLDNAIRYSPAGSKVDIALHARSIDIADNGPGVSAEDLVRIGERFYRPPGQEKAGSGLGLSIVRHIAAIHGMQVQFANRPSGGFIATLSW